MLQSPFEDEMLAQKNEEKFHSPESIKKSQCNKSAVQQEKQLLASDGPRQANHKKKRIGPKKKHENNQSRTQLLYLGKSWEEQLKTIEASKNPSVGQFDSVVAKCAYSRNWEAVLKVLESMHRKGLSPDLSTYKAIIQAFSTPGGREKNQVQVSGLILQVLNAMNHAGVQPDVDIYTWAIRTCAREGNLNDANTLFNTALLQELPLASEWFQDLIEAYAKAKMYERANALFRKMKENGLNPNIYAYNAILELLGNGKQPQVVRRLLDELLHPSEDAMFRPPAPNARTFIHAITGLGRGGLWQEALNALEQMERLGIKNNLVAHNAALSACERAHQWRAAQSLLEWMWEVKAMQPDKISFNTVISACAKAGKWKIALELLDSMKTSFGISPDRISYNSAISACAHAGKWSEAHVLMERARLDGIEPDVITYTSLINACSLSGQPLRGVDFLNMMKSNGIKPDVVAYTAAIDACSKGNFWKEALDLVDEMRDSGIEPNERTYRATITACGKGGRWERALNILELMRAKGLRANIFVYNAAASACEHAGQWQRVLGLLDGMRERGVEPDAFTFSTAISACGKAGQWQKAIELMETMRKGGPRMQPNVVTYTSALQACTLAGRWDEALHLWETMRNEGLQPDIIAYNTLLSASRRSNQWELALSILADMMVNNVIPDLTTLSNIIEVLDKNSQSKEADAVFQEAMKRKIILDSAMLDSTWEVDISHLPPPVAKYAVRYKLKQLKTYFQDLPKEQFCSQEHLNDLVLITGTGKKFFYSTKMKIDSTLVDTQTGDELPLQHHIKNILKKDYQLYSMVPKSLPGCLVISKSDLQAWLMPTEKIYPQA